MPTAKELRMEILPASENSIYEQRESGITHSPFQLEYELYQAISAGDRPRLESAIQRYLGNGLVMGRLSRNDLRQMQYWAVACISVAIHYAILGGLDETDAFNLSDHYIRHLDSMTSMEECVAYLRRKAPELADAVKDAKLHAASSQPVRKCLHFIHIHLHERLDITVLARETGLSYSRLSTLFRQETGVSLHTYILHEKLEAACGLLAQGQSINTISYNLAFCSESHFISCFRARYGMTPGQFRRSAAPPTSPESR